MGYDMAILNVNFITNIIIDPESQIIDAKEEEF